MNKNYINLSNRKIYLNIFFHDCILIYDNKYFNKMNSYKQKYKHLGKRI